VRFQVEVVVRPADYVQQAHRPRTEATIERTVEYVEAADQPFTTGECWRAAYGSYGCVAATLRSMRAAGLLVQVNPGSMPPRFIRSDWWVALPPS
jgi:hypothetical protein